VTKLTARLARLEADAAGGRRAALEAARLRAELASVTRQLRDVTERLATVEQASLASSRRKAARTRSLFAADVYLKGMMGDSRVS
jgi:hypothetical protein